jgi:putative transposase
MARQPRLISPDLPVHIVQRGNDRMECFREDNDFLFYRTQLSRLCKKFECALHAYCLMTNHVHLLLTPASANACAGQMKELSQTYAHYFNRKYARTGTLWEGRFRSCLVESAPYVLACYRYIELNPVRAGLVAHPSLYPWSSYAANAGIRDDALIAPHGEFTSLGTETKKRHSVYRSFTEEALAPAMLAEIRAATAGGYPLASDEFRSALRLRAGRRLERGRAGRPAKVAEDNKSVPDPDLFSAGGVS